MAKTLDLSIYLILDPIMCGGFENTLALAEATFPEGITIVQLRAPSWHKKNWYELALKLKPICNAYKIPLIINDHIDVALAVDADGVHIGQKDLPTLVSRKLLGEDKIIGLSTTNLQQIQHANSLPIDYVGIGPIFDTSTKPDADKALGFEQATQLIQASQHPSVLIGGLKTHHIPQIRQTGTNGLCVVSEICAAKQPKQITQQIKKQWSQDNS